MFAAGSKIEAIQRGREVSNVGLREAKQYIDDLAEQAMDAVYPSAAARDDTT